MKDEERARFLEQQTLYNSQVNDFTTALEEMEQLLEMWFSKVARWLPLGDKLSEEAT